MYIKSKAGILVVMSMTGLYLIIASSAYAWWNKSWTCQQQITFDNSGQAENLVNFPVLIKLSTSNFDYSKAKKDGTDLRFVDSDDNTELKYYFQKWDSEGESLVWVKIPCIDAKSKTDFIYLYYGNREAANVANPKDTYPLSFKGVWHLDETSGTLNDSTSNANHGTAIFNPEYGVEGKYGKAMNFRYDTQGVNLGNNKTLKITGSLTIGAWVDMEMHPFSYGRIITKEDPEQKKVDYTLATQQANTTPQPYFGAAGGIVYAKSSTASLAGDWAFIAGIFDAEKGSLSIAINGVIENTQGVSGKMLDTEGKLRIASGLLKSGDDYLTVDEPFVVAEALSPSWIKAMYLMGIDKFVSLSPHGSKAME